MTWFDTFSNVRSQLACFPHTVSNLTEMYKFLWAGSIWIRIHVVVPFMSMLLDHKVKPRQLFTFLPSLCNDLCSYLQSITNLGHCTLPSLEPYFLHPSERHTSPYGVSVCQNLKEYVGDVINI